MHLKLKVVMVDTRFGGLPRLLGSPADLVFQAAAKLLQSCCTI